MKVLNLRNIVYLLGLCICIGALFFSADALASLGSALSSFGTKISSNAGQLGVGAGLLTMFVASNQGCWFCGLYEELFDTMNRLSGMVATQLSDQFLILLGVGVLFYLVFKIGSTVVKLQEVDLMQFLGEIFKHLGRAIIAAAFLGGTVELYQYVISPFLAYSLGLTNTIVTQGNDLVASSGGAMGKVQSFINSGITGMLDADMPTMTGAAVDAKSNIEPFSDQLKGQIVGMLRLCSVSAISGMVVGALIMVTGLVDTIFFPNFQLIVIGLIILGAYFSIFLAVPFKLIDVMVRLSFVTALTPIWIILWVFPATVSYTKNAWEMLLNCCACFICLGVVMVMVFQIMAAMNPLTSASGIGEMITSAVLNGIGFNMFEKLNILSPTVLKTLALGMLATSMIKGSSQIATQIVKSYSAGIGDGMDKQMADSMKGMGGIGAVMGGIGMSALGGGAQGMEKLKDMARGFGGMLNSDVRNFDENASTKAKARSKYNDGSDGGDSGGPKPTPDGGDSGGPKPTPDGGDGGGPKS